MQPADGDGLRALLRTDRADLVAAVAGRPDALTTARIVKVEGA